MRMSCRLWLLLWSGTVWAESSGSLASAPGSEAQPVQFEVIPPTQRLAVVAFRHCIGGVTVQSLVDYAGDGAITSVQVRDSSGADALDRALNAWLRRAKVTATGRGGQALIPFAFPDIDARAPSAPTDPIRDCDMLARPSMAQLATALSAFGEVEPTESLMMVSAYSGAESPVTLVLAWDPTGRVVRIAIPQFTSSAESERSLAALAEAFRMRPGRGGEGYLYIGASEEAETKRRKPGR